MSTALRRDQEARARASKKQYLLDRIATSDGFQQGKEDTSSTLKRLLTALEDALTSHADVAGVSASDADTLARIGTDDALRALAALLETVRLRRRLGGLAASRSKW